MCNTNQSFQPAGYNTGWHLFHDWYKAIKWLFLFPVPKNAAKMCVCVCVCLCVCIKGFTYAENKLHHR